MTVKLEPAGEAAKIANSEKALAEAAHLESLRAANPGRTEDPLVKGTRVWVEAGLTLGEPHHEPVPGTRRHDELQAKIDPDGVDSGDCGPSY